MRVSVNSLAKIPQWKPESPVFPGYTVLARLGETLHFVTYRAQSENREALDTVLIRVIKASHLASTESARLKHEYELIAAANADGIVRVLHVIDTDGRLAIVTEDVSGVCLQEIPRGHFTMERFLILAARLAEILGNLHQNNISHRNVKPGSILINLEQDTVRLTDFGIALEITHANDNIYHPEVMNGTLVYMSPEQTGRMNCSADYRTDLYSLGVTFYEMLTGRVPFKASDAMETIHAHIAKVPSRPDRLDPDVPGPVADIVMKLLSKSPTDRYQNGFGLQSDLLGCLGQLRATGRIEPFELGLRDMSPKFIIPQIVVGRDNELATLHAAFERTCCGNVEIVLVRGEPGIGKSVLVGEMNRHTTAKGGHYISGKYDQLRQQVPYGPIIEAFQRFTRQLLSESEERILKWKERLLRALEPNARIITDVIPDMELIIGRQPQLPRLDPEENQCRFNHAFKGFVRVLAKQDHPLVIFIDDLQWADSASVSLMRSILTDVDLSSLLFIGAYRTSELEERHPLMLLVESLKKTGANLSTIALGALSLESTNQLIATLLRCSPERSCALSQSIQDKTGGNPFFVSQFLRKLFAARHIALEPGRGWTFDLHRIRCLELADNVVECVAKKLCSLPAAPLRLIELCSCIGDHINAHTLSIVSYRPIDEILTLLDVLIDEGLLYCSGDTYSFHHDRIREAAYSLLSETERESLHLHIGSTELGCTAPEELPNRIFHIVDQLNKGRRLVTESGSRVRLAELNLQAGIKAKESTAYKAAAAYLKSGLQCLDDSAWQTDYRLTYSLHKEQMECEYLDGNSEVGERLLEVVIAKAADHVDRAKAYNTMVVLYASLRSPKAAIALGLKALRLFGINLSVKMGPLPVLVELTKVTLALRKIPLDGLIDRPLRVDEERIAVGNLMASIGTPAFYVNTNLCAYLALLGVSGSLKYGYTPDSAAAFITLATIIQAVKGDYDLAYRIGEMSLKLNEKLGGKKMAGMVNHIFAFSIQHWKTHARRDIDVFTNVYRLSLNAGNYTYAGHSVNAAADCRLMVGDRLDDIYDDLRKQHELMNKVREPFITARYLENIQMIRNLKGQTRSRFSLTGEGYDEDEQIERMRRQNNLFGLCCLLIIRAKLLYLHGKYEDALLAAEELDRHIGVPVGTLLVSEHYFYYSLILTALLSRGETASERRYQRLIQRNQRKLKKWMRLCPENFLHKYLLVEAERKANAERFLEAVRLYHDAIRGARQSRYLHEEALGCERVGLFYRTHGCDQEAKLFMRMACDHYGHWGATTKTDALHELYPDLLPGDHKPNSSQSLAVMEFANPTSKLLDLGTVMQVSQVISSEIVLDRLLQKIMHMSITNAGAQRGYLLLESDGHLMVQASEDVDLGENRVPQSTLMEKCEGISHAVVNYVLRSGTSVILGNAMADGAFINDSHVVRERCKSVLCTPILSKGKLLGILYMENNLVENAFNEERLAVLRMISTQAAVSLENAMLFELATTDGLTKLLSRRYFCLMLDKEMHRSRRSRRPFAVVMVDIDNFKRFNDTYGHQLGDVVLRDVAKTLRRSIRSVDTVARYGGEEFVIMFPETDADGAMIAAEKVRAAIEQIEIRHEGQNLHVTISAGMAIFPRHAQNEDGLIGIADRGLYVSKLKGKNRVTVGDVGELGSICH